MVSETSNLTGYSVIDDYKIDLNLFKDYARSYVLPEDGKTYRHALPYAWKIMEENWMATYFVNPAFTMQDVLLIFQVLLFFLVVRTAASGIQYKPLKKVPSLFKHVGIKYDLVEPHKIEKFAENLWYFCWHSTSLTWNIWILSKEWGTPENPRWFQNHIAQPDGRWYWVPTEWEYAVGNLGWPVLLPSQSVRFFYLTQVAFWSSCSLFLWVETRRKDFSAMIIHHVATLFLCFFSYTNCYWRIGLIVLVLHDIVDVFLYWGKSLQHTKFKNIVIDLVFVGFVISYPICRLLLYPYYCVWPSINWKMLRRVSNNAIYTPNDVPCGYILPTFLIVLVLLHCYWYNIIITMFLSHLRQRAAGNTELKDLRSESESEQTTSDRSTDDKKSKKM